MARKSLWPRHLQNLAPVAAADQSGITAARPVTRNDEVAFAASISRQDMIYHSWLYADLIAGHDKGG